MENGLLEQESIEIVTEQVRSDLVGQSFSRTFNNTESKVIDLEKREIEFSFSSEFPVLRNKYWEVLGHNPDEIDTSLLPNAPLLEEHDRSKRLGAVINSVLREGKMRALVRFSRSSLGQDALNDVADGISTQVSTGYQITDAKEVGVKDGLPVVRMKWRPYEVSMVTIAADPSIGVGRSAEITNTITENVKMENENKDTLTVVSEAITADRQRSLQIQEMGKQYNLESDAFRFANDGKSLDEFARFALQRVNERAQLTINSAPSLDLTNKDAKAYSRARHIHAYFTGRKEKDAPHEYAIQNALCRAYNTQVEGILLPWNLQNTRLSDAGPVTFTTEGSDLAPAAYLANEYIKSLGNKLVLNTLGVRQLTGLTQPVQIGRMTTAPTAATPATENAGVNGSLPVWDAVSLSPKKVSAFVELSKDIQYLSPVDLQAEISQEVDMQLARKIQYNTFFGAGSPDPTGLTNLSINDGNLSSTGLPTFADVVKLRTMVDADNAFGPGAYVLNSNVAGYLETQFTNKTYGSQQIYVPSATLDGEGRIGIGYRAVTCNTLTDAIIVWGIWNEMYLATFGPGIDLTIDTVSGARYDKIYISATARYDIGVKHLNAFASMENISGI